MERWLKRSLGITLFALAACGGSGGGCSSCGGVGALENGFPADKRVENAASVRLTKSGLKFLGDNGGMLAGKLLGGGSAMTFPIPKVSAGPATVCDGGNKPNANPPECQIDINLGGAKLNITSATPHLIKVGGTIPIKADRLPLDMGPVSLRASLGNGSCNGVGFADVPLEVEIAIETDTADAHGPAKGLSKIRIAKLDPQLTSGDLHLCTTCSIPFICDLGDAVLNGIKNALFGILVNQIKAPLTSQISNALCVSGDPKKPQKPCPGGSSLQDPNNPTSKCVYSDGACASTKLGLEGSIDLGGLLASLSPTTKGGLDFVLNVGGPSANPSNPGSTYGDLNPANEGVTLSMVGGALPRPVSDCVPLANMPIPDNIPTPDELLENNVSGWPGGSEPHFGLALSEKFLNYAMSNVYNSGLLCVQITSARVAQLTSNAVGLLLPSMKNLPTMQQNSALGLVLRPTQPPTIKVGNGSNLTDDANLGIDLKALGIDFYVWSTDRFVRAFTVNMDLNVPVNLDVSAKGLTPTLDKINVANTVVTNSGLLKEDPTKIAGSIEGLIGAFVGPLLGGGFRPIDLNSMLAGFGLKLNIPPTIAGQGSPGLRKLTKTGQNFLGIFASLDLAATNTSGEISETTLELIERKANDDGLHFGRYTKDNLSVVRVLAGSSLNDGAHNIEYTYRVDGSFWHPWTAEREITVNDDYMRLQGHHKVEVKSRIVGQPHSETKQPAAVDFVLDVDPPFAELTKPEAGLVKVDAIDYVTAKENIEVRVAPKGQDFGKWVKLGSFAGIPVDEAKETGIEVRDEEGNVRTIQAALRGKVDTTGMSGSGSGCGCTVPKHNDSQSRWPLFGAALAMAAAFARMNQRRKRRKQRLREAAAGVALMGVAGSWAGCSCSDDASVPAANPAGGGAGEGGSAGGAGYECLEENECYVLKPGLIGAYTSVAKASDGTIWVAGYNEADYDGEADPYNDLVVGKYDESAKKVNWETVDGIDADEVQDPEYFDPNGWRGGLEKSGDDVGRWTSIAIGEGDNPIVSYYDATNKAVKFASYDGSKWSSHTVEKADGASNGLYSKMLVVGGKPTIVYLHIAPGAEGGLVSSVRVATASTATPSSSSDWAFENISENPKTPCWFGMCGSKTCNTKSGKCETTTSGCAATCADSEECFENSTGNKNCGVKATKANLTTYPEATGLYVSVAAIPGGGFGVIYYDRIRGNLFQARKGDMGWQTVLLDGQTAGDPGTDTGDTGVGASLAIDSNGDWHVSYVDGIKETLKYLKITGGMTPETPETVDDGAPLAAMGEVGKHIVGDDSNLVVASNGDIRIAYQDATAGNLRLAVKTMDGWTVKPISQSEKFTGYFPRQVEVGGSMKIATWWRAYGGKSEGDVAFLDP